MIRIPSLTCVALLAGVGTAAAHPHIFIETGLRLIHDQSGTLTAVEVTWTYDELFSLLLLEDQELDADFDGVLTESEQRILQGFDMDWPADFEGDVYVTAGGSLVALGAPVPGLAELNDKGQLVGRHTRPLAVPVDPVANPVVIKVYDPTYYSAYEIIVDAVSTEADTCKVEVFAPDLDTAYAQLEQSLNELMGQSDFNQEIDFPTVGDRFAEEVRLVCTGGS